MEITKSSLAIGFVAIVGYRLWSAPEAPIEVHSSNPQFGEPTIQPIVPATSIGFVQLLNDSSVGRFTLGVEGLFYVQDCYGVVRLFVNVYSIVFLEDGGVGRFF